MEKISIKRRNESERIDGTAAIYAIIHINREKVRIPIGITVKRDEWDAKNECVKGRGKAARDMNLIISNTKAKITDIFVKARLSEERLTKDSFKALYSHPEETDDFIQYAWRHLDTLRPAFQWETQKSHSAALRKLQAYAKHLPIGEITADWLRLYASYLRDKLHNNPNTVRKNLCVLRMHYYAAMRAGLTRDNPFERFKLPTPQPAVVYLTEEELDRLIYLYRSGTLTDPQADALRFFLFMTFTAMHISDARALRIEQIFGGEIHYRRVKTRTSVDMPLSEPAAKLVEYYRAGRNRGPLFVGLPTDQAFNRVIKAVCAKAGIYKDVSAKAGRHTFATLYYKKNNGDIGTLSKLLGHTQITTTMIYAHIMKDGRMKGVAAFDGML